MKYFYCPTHPDMGFLVEDEHDNADVVNYKCATCKGSLEVKEEINNTDSPGADLITAQQIIEFVESELENANYPELMSFSRAVFDQFRDPINPKLTAFKVAYLFEGYFL